MRVCCEQCPSLPFRKFCTFRDSSLPELWSHPFLPEFGV